MPTSLLLLVRLGCAPEHSPPDENEGRELHEAARLNGGIRSHVQRDAKRQRSRPDDD